MLLVEVKIIKDLVLQGNKMKHRKSGEMRCGKSCNFVLFSNNHFTTFVMTGIKADLGPYFKSKLELKSNSSEVLQVNCKFIRDIFLSYAEIQT